MFEVVRKLFRNKTNMGGQMFQAFKNVLEARKVDRNKTFDNLHFQ